MDAHDQHDDEEVLVDVELDADTWAHYEARADAAGRTLNAQIRYELSVNHGLCAPDPGDTEATQRGQLFRRIFKGKVLHG